jgi:hypothetical protein
MFLFVCSPRMRKPYGRSVHHGCTTALELQDTVACVRRCNVFGRNLSYSHMKYNYTVYGALPHATRNLSRLVVATRIILLSRVSNGTQVSQNN